jgi:DNA-binding transcriptional LysR family regulator
MFKRGKIEPMNLDLLEAFTCAVREGSVQKAALTLNLTQPAVTARLKRLEEALGVQLLRRSVSGVTPSAAGLTLLDHAGKIREAVERAFSDVSKAGSTRGRLELFASNTTGNHVLPILLARFCALHPAVAARLRIGNSAEVLAAVRKGSADLGMVEGLDTAPGLRLESYLQDELVPVVSARSTITLNGWSGFERHSLLWREDGSGSRNAVVRALRKAGIPRTALRPGAVYGSRSLSE